jgi:O2-independent ubiquinone biosynthesis accessory factor UbiT
MQLRSLFLNFPVSLVPGPVQAVTLSIIINRLLRGQTLRMRLGEVNGKTVTIRIPDIPWEMHFLIRDRHIRAMAETVESDVTISGNMDSFLDLLSRREDPDALFFQRRLNMEGDTKTGVHVKNLLDSLEYDWDAHFDSVLVPALAEQAKRLHRRIRKRFN